MNVAQQQAISGFIAAVNALRSAGIVRSHRYLGDIGEFLCADAFGIDLAQNLRQIGHDGKIDSRRVQVKYHGGKSTTVDLGNPAQYDDVFIVLGPDSVIRLEGFVEEFIVYQLSAETVRSFASENGNFYCTERRLPTSPTRRIGLGGHAV